MKPRVVNALTGCLIAALLATGFGSGSTPTAAAAPTSFPAPASRLGPGAGLYPRLIQLSHSGRADGAVLASTVTFDGAAGLGAVFRSDDQGRSFTRIGTVTDPDAGQGRGLCCATLYELPRRIGALPAGTLLWAASVGQAATTDRRMSIRIYASRDHGRSWSHLATPAVAQNDGGLWEPEFTVDRAGELVVFFSDETDQPAHSQLLVASRSRDGRHWSRRSPVVAGNDPDARPGMPIVRRIGTGPRAPYLMTYEVCGGDYRCRVHHRSSRDGWHWGEPSDLGGVISATDGTLFEHAPTFTWTPRGTGPGRIYLVGQVLVGPDGTPAVGNGRTVLTSDHGPGGPWRPIAAPVVVPDPYDNYCPNYSSPLLALPTRHHLTQHRPTQLLEIASGYDANQVCAAGFGVGRG